MSENLKGRGVQTVHAPESRTVLLAVQTHFSYIHPLSLRRSSHSILKSYLTVKTRYDLLSFHAFSLFYQHNALFNLSILPTNCSYPVLRLDYLVSGANNHNDHP
jgi:hypothetical protein